jgi:hypothetical protein
MGNQTAIGLARNGLMGSVPDRSRSLSAVSEAPMSEELGVETLWRMVWRRWVTESSSSATQTSSDDLDGRLPNTRMRPPHSGLVQVGIADRNSPDHHRDLGF